MGKAIIICRASSAKQARTGDTLPEQEKDGRRFCEARGIQAIRVFTEQISGKALNRPVLNEALEYCRKRGDIDYCIITKIDR